MWTTVERNLSRLEVEVLALVCCIADTCCRPLRWFSIHSPLPKDLTAPMETAAAPPPDYRSGYKQICHLSGDRRWQITDQADVPRKCHQFDSMCPRKHFGQQLSWTPCRSCCWHQRLVASGPFSRWPWRDNRLVIRCSDVILSLSSPGLPRPHLPGRWVLDPSLAVVIVTVSYDGNLTTSQQGVRRREISIVPSPC